MGTTRASATGVCCDAVGFGLGFCVFVCEFVFCAGLIDCLERLVSLK